jgi:hypothetical protein
MDSSIMGVMDLTQAKRKVREGLRVRNLLDLSHIRANDQAQWMHLRKASILAERLMDPKLWEILIRKS